MKLESVGYRRYALAALTAVYTLNLVDRGLVSLLLQPIKEDLHLSDTQLGFLTGIAFGLFYACLGVPLARWADRGNRVTITSLAIGIWGITVMASVFVTSYLQLVFARIIAAVGEAGCKPPTYSLLGDYFPEPAERLRAMAIYITGGSVSSLLSFILGGWLNELYGWRNAFLLLGIPGLILAVLVRWTVIEPRVGSTRPRTADRPVLSMRALLAMLWTRRSCRHLSIALILLYTMGLGLSPWYAAFMIRSHGMGTRELGIWLGLIFGFGGIVGVLSGGFVASRWFADNERGQMRLSAVMVALLVPCYIVFLTVPQKLQALIALAPLITVFSVFLGPTYALMQRLVPDEMRATMMAVVMLLANLIGMGIGPQIVGILSDGLQPTLGDDSLRAAMLVMSFVALWAGYHFWKVGQFVNEDLSAVIAELPSDSGAAETSRAEMA
jgi:MFS family permease